ncbi:hypothetical protein HanXRQr2_Chr09g0418121 [Helianthus annuus]|uniref:Uncharacterized protein n=1 Tax=Helianthus annuus TaxID=4232 RepID=A0A9K3NAY7_HELAN|nr:hypothetical protein HanXRQr2_Chr09g0418121 [Helianthus annuus]
MYFLMVMSEVLTWSGQIMLNCLKRAVRPALSPSFCLILQNSSSNFWRSWGGQNSSIMIAFNSFHVSSYAASFPRLFLSAVHQSKARDWKTPVALRVRR